MDVWANPAVAKKSLGVLPDRLRLFDRLTGSEFLHHAGALRGLDRQTISSRVDDLERAFGIEHSAQAARLGLLGGHDQEDRASRRP